VEIENNEADSRWEAKTDGKVVGFVEYKSRPGHMTFIHTEVDPEHEGQGIASRLARTVLDDAVSRGMRMTLYCPFITAYVTRHPEYEQYIDPPRSEQ
jgi:predicted GNAT family acetyltransferase